jgi:hypothetical protein
LFPDDGGKILFCNPINNVFHLIMFVCCLYVYLVIGKTIALCQSLLEEVKCLKRDCASLEDKVSQQNLSRTRQRVEDTPHPMAESSVPVHTPQLTLPQASSSHHGQERGIPQAAVLFIQNQSLQSQNFYQARELRRLEQIDFERKQTQDLQNFKWYE